MSAAGDRLRRIADRAEHEGGKAAAEAMAEAAAIEMRAGLARRSHPPQTRTPSPPGSPPARISGRLLRSIFEGDAYRIGPARWEAQAGSRGLVYAAIQNRGGIIRARRARYLTWVTDGVRHFRRQVRIPARPYIAPGAEKARATGRTERASQQAFRRAVHGGR